MFSGSHELAIAGRTVGEVRHHLRHVLNISDDAASLVNGSTVADDYVMKEDDTLEFRRGA